MIGAWTVVALRYRTVVISVAPDARHVEWLPDLT